MIEVLMLLLAGIVLYAMSRRGVVPFGMNVQTQTGQTDQPPSGQAGLDTRSPAPIVVDANTLASAIGEVFKRALTEFKDAVKPAPPAPELSAEDTKRVSSNDLVKPWQRRLVRYFNSLVLEGQGRTDEAIRLRKQIVEEYRSLPDFAKEAEEKEAVDYVKANLTGLSTTRLISTLTDASGGYLLPKPFLAEVFVIVEKYGVARRLFRPVLMTSKTLDLKNVATKPVAYWVDEGGRILASDVTFGAGQLVTKKLAGLAVWTAEQNEDEAIASLPIITELFAEAIIKKEDEAAFIGDGTATYGGFTGVLNAAGKVYTMPATKVNFSDLVADDLRKAIDQLSLSSREGAMFFADPDITSIVERLKDNNGQYILRSPADGDGLSRVYGKPWVEVDVMPDSGASGVNKKFIVLGNPKYALMGQRRGYTAELSREAVIQDGAGDIVHNLFQEDKAAIRITERIGFTVPLGDRFVAIRTAAA